MSEWAVKAAAEYLIRENGRVLPEEVEDLAEIFDRHAAAEKARLAAEVERLLAEMTS